VNVIMLYVLVPQEPLCLSNCVISQGENEFQDFVEINEISSKNTYHLQVSLKKG